MTTKLTTLILILCINAGLSSQKDIGSNYIEAYKEFYPSKALAMGIQSSLWNYEDLSPQSIKEWVKYNQSVLESLQVDENSYSLHHPIDARLLNLQILSEIDKWETQKIQRNRLSLYSSLIANALSKVFDNDYLTPSEKSNLICQRLDAVKSLCVSAKSSLKFLEKRDYDSGVQQLEKTIDSYRNEVLTQLENLSSDGNCEKLKLQLNKAVESMEDLVTHVKTSVARSEGENNLAIGKAEYAEKLLLYTDGLLKPETLEKMALQEIEVTKDLMFKVSKEILGQARSGKDLPKERDAVIKLALDEMQKDVPTSGQDYLSFWLELRDATLKFIKENDIVTLPDFQTLRILNAPESAGPAARIGWVGVAPTFDPNPVTTLYLPSIPDTLPLKEQQEFWASFNKPFNRMIVIHELIPGHYHQKKIFRESPHYIRLFFPYALYTEGYATFTERVLLEAGWEKDDPLTYLAHLRKRLENANRAYTSVQMHCNNWTEEMVWDFSINTSLLAPQFAKSLWGRISQRPMQVISYFVGGQQFSELYDYERLRLGNDFNLKAFMDTILTIGPIPTDEYYKIFQDKYPSE